MAGARGHWAERALVWPGQGPDEVLRVTDDSLGCLGGTRDQSPDQPEQWQVLMVSRVACGEAIFRRHPVSGLDLLYS